MRALLNISACLVLASCKRTPTHAAPSFEGIIETVDSSHRSYVYEVRGNVARRERQGSKSYAILTAKGPTVRVRECPSGPVVFTPPPDPGESFAATSVRATGGHDVVAGLACDLYEATSSDAKATVCATSDIAPFVSWGRDEYPLRMDVVADGQHATTSVTRIERKPIDPTRVEVPARAKVASTWEELDRCP